MIQLTIDKEEYQQILEALQVYTRVCADEQKKKVCTGNTS